MTPRPVIIDTDPGVDDAMALLMALASPELDVVGLTTIFGNAETTVTTANAIWILEVAGRADIPVTAGASAPLAAPYLGPVPQVHGANGIGGTDPVTPAGSAAAGSAADALFAAVAKRPGEVSILALGPLTNLAIALDRHPSIVDLVAEVVVMGGNALVPGNATPVAEANINNDPEAADAVFGAGWPIVMVGLDVTHQVNLAATAIARITGGETPEAHLLAAAVPTYQRFFEVTNGLDGIYVHDPTAVAYLIAPDAFTTERWPLRVETESFSRGKTWPNLNNTDEAVLPAWNGRPLVQVCTGVDANQVLALVESRLGPPR
ncbi:MAG: nucleoside hydrolase [Actinomycetota bacterium]